MNILKLRLIKTHCFIVAYKNYSQNIKIINCKIVSCGTAIGGDNLNGVIIQGLEVINTPKIIDVNKIVNSNFEDINIKNKEDVMNGNEMNYLIRTKSIKNTKINNIKIESTEVVGIISSDEICGSTIENINYNTIRIQNIDEMKNILLTENIGSEIIPDLENFKINPSSLKIISQKIKSVIEYCDNSNTIRAITDLAVKIGLESF
ncbi:MAG: hypothetical protein ACRC5T_06065 [Cetobacterium sp.]